jgi:hypothetical protein
VLLRGVNTDRQAQLGNRGFDNVKGHFCVTRPDVAVKMAALNGANLKRR